MSLRHSTRVSVRHGIVTIPIHKAHSGDPLIAAQDLLAVEEPLEIRVNGRPLSITMRTPGHDVELALGFLFTEGIIQSRDDVIAIESRNNAVELTLAESIDPGASRNFYTTSSCGVCGKASIESLYASGCSMLPDLAVATEIIHRLPDKLRMAQRVFEHTGALHGAALFDSVGNLEMIREDVGRHNAVDKLVGAAFFGNLTPLAKSILMLSGRASFELAQKAVVAGIPVVAAVGAPSSLAVETAQRFGMTLLGFLRDNRFNVYSGAARLNS